MTATALDLALGAVVPEHRRTLTTTFRAMDVAEEALARRYGPGEEPPGAFRVLQPSALLSGRPPLLRPHAEEVLDRLDRGEDLRPGTRAECLAAAMEAAARAPLRHDHYVAAKVLFLDVMGREVAVRQLGEDEVCRAEEDRDRGRVPEILDELRRVCRDEDRRIE